jgi:threonine/homoserine efflux transporter RhtA
VLSSLKGCFYIAHGIYLIGAGIAVGVFCWVIPYLLNQVATSSLIEPEQIPAAAWRVLEHRNLMPLLALPAVILGVVSLFKVPGRWLWVTLGAIALAAPAVILVYTFVVTIGLLYQSGG